MGRVESLLQKLQEQIAAGASPSQLLITVQMMQHELLHLQQFAPADEKKSVAISMPFELVNTPAVENQINEEKIVEILQVNEEEIEAELQEIKKNAAAISKMSNQGKPMLIFDSLDDEELPTLRQQPVDNTIVTKEINQLISEEKASLNETLKEKKIEISDALTDTPVKDLKKAIGINDRYLFINELFRGDEAMYERSIKTINSFTIWPEAEYWIKRELKTKQGWLDTNEVVKQFDQLVKRRFL